MRLAIVRTPSQMLVEGVLKEFTRYPGGYMVARQEDWRAK